MLHAGSEVETMSRVYRVRRATELNASAKQAGSVQ